jgi:histidinol-phosphate phosphatase family protein
LRLLQAAGYRLILVSNQSGIARGYFDESELDAIEARVRDALREEGVHLDGWYCCPHHPAGSVAQYAVPCICRKPGPGLILLGAREHGVARRDSWMAGDILDDIEAGRRAGCRTVLIDNGNETEWRRGPSREPHYRASHLLGVARAILAADRVTRAWRPAATRAGVR